MSKNWWSKKLGGGSPAPQPSPPTSPSTPGHPTGNAGPAPPRAAPQQGQQHESVTTAIQDPSVWKGKGQAAKTELDRCPACNSNNYFSRKGNGIGGNAPAAHCYECGYPVQQYGSETQIGA